LLYIRTRHAARPWREGKAFIPKLKPLPAHPLSHAPRPEHAEKDTGRALKNAHSPTEQHQATCMPAPC
jgi:hypothetical protein